LPGRPLQHVTVFPARTVNATHVARMDRVSAGAGYRIRTCDPVITNHVLYQLS
jgi:hypothetical protein